MIHERTVGSIAADVESRVSFAGSMHYFIERGVPCSTKTRVL
jgi:hypothetical protein